MENVGTRQTARVRTYLSMDRRLFYIPTRRKYTIYNNISFIKGTLHKRINLAREWYVRIISTDTNVVGTYVILYY